MFVIFIKQIEVTFKTLDEVICPQHVDVDAVFVVWWCDDGGGWLANENEEILTSCLSFNICCDWSFLIFYFGELWNSSSSSPNIRTTERNYTHLYSVPHLYQFIHASFRYNAEPGPSLAKCFGKYVGLNTMQYSAVKWWHLKWCWIVSERRKVTFPHLIWV